MSLANRLQLKDPTPVTKCDSATNQTKYCYNHRGQNEGTQYSCTLLFIVAHKKILDYVAILTLGAKAINIINVSPVQLTSASALLSHMVIVMISYLYV